MGKIADSLHGLFETLIAHLVEEQSKNYGRGETKDHFIETDENRIQQNLKAVGAGEEKRKVLESYPVPGKNRFIKTLAQHRFVILKSNEKPQHGAIPENQEIQKRGEKHEEQ